MFDDRKRLIVPQEIGPQNIRVSFRRSRNSCKTFFGCKIRPSTEGQSIYLAIIFNQCIQGSVFDRLNRRTSLKAPPSNSILALNSARKNSKVPTLVSENSARFRISVRLARVSLMTSIPQELYHQAYRWRVLTVRT